ncbi:hypothetical protein DFH27DRAFT_195058 [Peziza echinospora]|nr:hypothetical protein DFH27DRAFT_195058 [Peziza echinospora]
MPHIRSWPQLEIPNPNSGARIKTRKRPLTTELPDANTNTGLEPRFLRLINILNELEEMCALGVVDIEMPRRGMAGIEAPDGWLWLDTPARTIEGQSVEAWMGSLIDCGHLRATYVMTSNTTARVRIYMLPEDIGAGLIREIGSTQRKNLRNLLKNIDTSIQGWQGSIGHERTSLALKPAIQEFTSPTNEIYGFDVNDLKFYRDPTYPESIRRSRYTFRRK